jgi:hypothetical protein
MTDDTDKQEIGYVENIVKGIVDNPSDVKVRRRVDEMGVLLTLEVNPEDMGKVIGKEGQTAKAIRTLLRVYGAKSNARINLKILEPEGSERAKRPEQPTPAADAKPAPAKTVADKEETTPLEEKATEVV